MKKIFIAAPFTHNFDGALLRNMEKWLQDSGYAPVVPHDFVEEKVEKLHESVKRDFRLLDDSDVLIAEASKPSHGVGMEILHAYEAGKKVILIVQHGTRLSSVARVHAHHIIEYNSFDDLKPKLEKILHAVR